MNEPWCEEKTVYQQRPAFQGSTLHTWIGFKRFIYLMEEAVLAYFRERGCGPHQLYHQYGLCFEMVDAAIRIFYPLSVDDLVTAEVQRDPANEDGAFGLKVQFFIDRDGKRLKPLSGRVKVLFRRTHQQIAAVGIPAVLSPYICDEIQRPPSQSVPDNGPAPMPLTTDEEITHHLAPPGTNAFVWKWQIPYYYCHDWDRIQHAGYVALLEGVVPLFLAARGISIHTMLESRGWIPVVPQAQVEILHEAAMEEPIYTVYTVEEIFKELTYTARMDCYVHRDRGLCHTATGRIVHGYAQVQGQQAWGLAQFDAATLTALRGNGR